MFGLGLLKGTAIGLTGGIVIGLVIKEACKQMKNKKIIQLTIIQQLTLLK